MPAVPFDFTTPRPPGRDIVITFVPVKDGWLWRVVDQNNDGDIVEHGVAAYYHIATTDALMAYKVHAVPPT